MIAATSRFPLRSREITGGKVIAANAAGKFFMTDRGGMERLSRSDLAKSDLRFLLAHSQAATAADPLGHLSHELQIEARRTVTEPLDYLILVPTLRCDLACSYCQVSRANLDASGFDWSDETLRAVLDFIDGLDARSVKIEFQGGEPTLRPDLISAVIERCQRFDLAQFVICTNLSRLDDEIMGILARDDVFVSTSLDGDAMVHEANRTQDSKATEAFFANLRLIVDRFGPDKASALPTINPDAPPAIDALIDAYLAYGFSSIFLRPINYQGFARKRHPRSREQDQAWWAYYDAFVDRIIERNFLDRSVVLDEPYLTLCLQRMFRAGLDRHVDLRNPNPVGRDYVLIDYDGTIYPTDEARMLTRSGVVDLAIGDLWGGFDSELREMLDRHSTNYGDPACDACVYQPFCGRDLVDDLSRYGRIDMPRHETAFCRKHLHLFDRCAGMIYSNDPAVQYSLARWLGLAGDQLPALPVLT